MNSFQAFSITQSRKALLVRVDRMGDLVLTLSSDSLARDMGVETRWCIPKGLEPVLQAGGLGDSFFAIDRTFSVAGFKSFYRQVLHYAPDVSIVFHAPPWVAFALWLARVPHRSGVLSQWWSFALYNCGLRQKRSLASKHESEYNADLVEHALRVIRQKDEQGAVQTGARLPLSERKLTPLKLQSLSTDSKSSSMPTYVVIHPGMGGSAQNWPLSKYEKLVRSVLSEGLHEVYITGTASDSAWTLPLRSALAANLSAQHAARLHWRDQGQSLDQLMQLLAGAVWVAAPSTGVVHLAASLGVPTVGLYSPVQVQAPLRWGPRGERAVALVAQVSCPGHHACLMKECPSFDCMNQITVEQVLNKARELSK